VVEFYDHDPIQEELADNIAKKLKMNVDGVVRTKLNFIFYADPFNQRLLSLAF